MQRKAAVPHSTQEHSLYSIRGKQRQMTQKKDFLWPFFKNSNSGNSFLLCPQHNQTTLSLRPPAPSHPIQTDTPLRLSRSILILRSHKKYSNFFKSEDKNEYLGHRKHNILIYHHGSHIPFFIFFNGGKNT